MPKFCGKCGSKIDETTGLCPECNKNSDLLNTFETDKSDSHINTDIDTAVTSKSEYVEEKATNISEKAVVSKFCKKCGSKIDTDTGLCPMCNKIGDLHNISNAENSGAIVDTDINNAITSVPEHEEKVADISENTVVSKFCKKCDSKIDVDTGLCQKCNFSEINESIYSDNEKISVEIDYEEQKNIIENSNSNDSCYSDEKRSRFDNEKLEENELSDNGNSLKNKKNKVVLKATIISILVLLLLAVVAFLMFNGRVFYIVGVSESNVAKNNKVSAEEITKMLYGEENTTPNDTAGSSSAKAKSNPQEPTEKILESWQTSLIECCINDDENDGAQFVLLYINDDDIPEIYSMRKSKSEFDNYDIIYCVDNIGDSLGTSGVKVSCKSLYYYEKGNLCCEHTNDYDSVLTMSGDHQRLISTNATFNVDSAIYAPNCTSYTRDEIINIIENM